MPGPLEPEIIQQQKGRWLLRLGASSLVLLLCLALRFVPRLNDWLAGPPAYIEAFASIMGPQIADLLHDEYPVLVMRNEKLECDNLPQDATTDYQDAVYVLSFSERSRALCLTVYGVLSEGSNAAGSITLTPGVGHNYGRSLGAPAKVAPLTRDFTVLNPAYLSLLHWRTSVDAQAKVPAAKTARFASPSAVFRSADLSVSIHDLRAQVAQRRERVNSVLFAAQSMALVVLPFSVARLRRLHERFAWYLRACDHALPLREFLFHDAVSIAQHAQASHAEEQHRMHAQARTESIVRRAQEDARHALELLLPACSDETRRRVEPCLERNHGEEMRTLLAELRAHAAQKTPEERLAQLLDSFRQYCTEEEFQECRSEALDVLGKAGFREARELAVALHDRFRARAKAREEQETEEAAPSPQSLTES